MHQQHRIRVGGNVVVFVVVSLLLLGGVVNPHGAITVITRELVMMSEMRTQLAEAKLSAFKNYLNFSH